MGRDTADKEFVTLGFGLWSQQVAPLPWKADLKRRERHQESNRGSRFFDTAESGAA